MADYSDAYEAGPVEKDTYTVGDRYMDHAGSYSLRKDADPGNIAEEQKRLTKKWVTRDSGARAEFDSGMRRDTEEGKARFDLLIPEGVPYSEQMLTRFADLLARGAEKYSARNWEKANSQAELDRYKSSGFRHFMQWISGETDEDHAAAAMFNIMCYEMTKWKIENETNN